MTYMTIRGYQLPNAQVFGTDALVVKEGYPGDWSVMAVVRDYATAQTIVNALNGASA